MAKAATEIEKDAKDPGLKSALQAGSKTSEQWGQRIERALAEAGGAEDVGAKKGIDAIIAYGLYDDV